jgi:hypothetical protein
MVISSMRSNIERYMGDRALFTSDVLSKALKWQTNYTHPLAMGYRDAKSRLEDALTAAEQDSTTARERLAEINASIGLAVGIASALLGPLVSRAFSELSATMRITESDVDARVLSQWYSPTRTPDLTFEALISRAQLRRAVLNHVVEVGTTSASSAASAAVSTATSTGSSAPQRSTSSGISTNSTDLPGMLSGNFTTSEFEQYLQDKFNRLAVEMIDRYQAIFDGPQQEKRQFLINATKTILVTPPPRPLTELISCDMLSRQIFPIIAGNYILSYRPGGASRYPQLGYNTAYRINEQLNSCGFSIITDGPRIGVMQRFGDAFPRGDNTLWSGIVMPLQKEKIMENGRNCSGILETYMEAIALTEGVT